MSDFEISLVAVAGGLLLMGLARLVSVDYKEDPFFLREGEFRALLASVIGFVGVWAVIVGSMVALAPALR